MCVFRIWKSELNEIAFMFKHYFVGVVVNGYRDVTKFRKIFTHVGYHFLCAATMQLVYEE
jgi:hypothetical protein